MGELGKVLGQSVEHRRRELTKTAKALGLEIKFGVKDSDGLIRITKKGGLRESMWSLYNAETFLKGVAFAMMKKSMPVPPSWDDIEDDED